MRKMYVACDGSLFANQDTCEDYEGDLFYGHASFYYTGDSEMSWETVLDELNSDGKFINAIYCDTDHTAELVNQLLDDYNFCKLDRTIRGMYGWDEEKRLFVYHGPDDK